jgi:hypothetical protein
MELSNYLEFISFCECESREGKVWEERGEKAETYKSLAMYSKHKADITIHKMLFVFGSEDMIFNQADYL